MTGADLVVTGGDRAGTVADIVIVDGRIAGPAPAPVGAATLDATGLLVAPGFVDLQCNGAAGIDLTTEPERLWELAAVLPRWGVTAWLPTIVTAPSDVRRRALSAWRTGPTLRTPATTTMGTRMAAGNIGCSRDWMRPGCC